MPSYFAATVSFDKFRAIIRQLVLFGSLARRVDGLVLKKKHCVWPEIGGHLGVSF